MIGKVALAVALMAIAGYVDAIGLLRLGHFFVSFMSGNTTEMSVAAMHGDWREAEIGAGIVGLFVLGVAIGQSAKRATPDWAAAIILAAEALLLAAAAYVGLTPGIVLVVLAMGMQNLIVRRIGGTGVGLTYVTGTLVHLGEKLADAFVLAGHRLDWLLELALWLGLVFGAGAGALVYGKAGMTALLLPAGILAALAVIEIVAVFGGAGSAGR